MLVKIYGSDKSQKTRYSPAAYEGAKKTRINGAPEDKRISTSYIERQNLTMRMRRFTRLTNGFSKKLENHMHAISLHYMHYMHYNFCRIHKTLSVTPAMEAGVTTKLHNIEWIVDIADSMEPAPKKRGPYKKRTS